ncbi:hypothetical protein [Fluviicola sp.]|uniref:hypothetical protein n=1 Tax=Fluviicola sp. TaxID=1917219 RepID=UPI002607233E|nr:hypothetical protein [Fluviicola sp.]
MYYYYKTKLICCVSIVSIIVLSTISFGQTPGTDSLLQLRSQLISSNQSTTEVDLLLHQSGTNPTCIIQQSDDYTFSFTAYQPLGNEQREQKVNLRLKAHYPFLTLIDFSSDFTTVQIKCNEPLSPTIINELVTHFGYSGYETH